MAERFDVLFSGLSEEEAIRLLHVGAETLDNPGIKYIAASRLGACDSRESLVQLIEFTEADTNNLYDKIAKRKAIEALGRRKDHRALPSILKALACGDEPSVVNAADALTRIGAPLSTSERQELIKALEGGDNQKRAIIQTHTRLGLEDNHGTIRCLEEHDNPLVAGAARAYGARHQGRRQALQPLIQQLQDELAGRRRAAVIDLGDAGDVGCLRWIVTAPVSMPLRAKSAFGLVEISGGHKGKITADIEKLLEQLLRDHPDDLQLRAEWSVPQDPEQIEQDLCHRDEGKQYRAVQGLLTIGRKTALPLIDHLRSQRGSDYGVHYHLTCSIGFMKFHERADLVRASLEETAPQYAKSRVAASWACLALDMDDQAILMRDLAEHAPWKPLRWSCERVLQKLHISQGLSPRAHPNQGANV